MWHYVLCHTWLTCRTEPPYCCSVYKHHFIAPTLHNIVSIMCRYISAMGYGFEGYTRAEFEDVTYPCSIPGLFNNTMFDYLPLLLPNANVTYTGQGFNTTVPLADLRTNPLYATILSDQLQIQAEANPNCIVNLGAIVTYFQLFRPMWTTFVILIGYLGVVHVLTYLGLLNLTRKERR